MKVSATFKYLRISSKKIRELAHTVVGLRPQDALDRLSTTGEKSAGFLTLAIKSVLANAVNNMKLDPMSLKIKTVEILKGPSFKRWQPVSRGMAHSIKKRTTHLRIVVEDIIVAKNAPVKKEANEVKSEVSNVDKKEEKKTDMKNKKSERSHSGTKS